MLRKLRVYHFAPDRLPSNSFDGSFVLVTCQRALVVSLDDLVFDAPMVASYQAADAYAFLLQVLCGLHSKLLAETEIIRQFKKSYLDYSEKKGRCGHLMKVIERLFKDAKEIRHTHLRTVSGRSYASLCRKIVSKEKEVSRALIIGSGELAKDLIKFFRGTLPLSLSARNESVVSQLQTDFKIDVIDWKDYSQWLGFQCIINTVGIDDSLFDHQFFETWKNRHLTDKVFVDLGSPSPVRTSFSSKEGVYRLDDILKLADESAEKNDQLVSMANLEIAKRAEFRLQYFIDKKNKSCCQSKGAVCAHI